MTTAPAKLDLLPEAAALRAGQRILDSIERRCRDFPSDAGYADVYGRARLAEACHVASELLFNVLNVAANVTDSAAATAALNDDSRRV